MYAAATIIAFHGQGLPIFGKLAGQFAFFAIGRLDREIEGACRCIQVDVVADDGIAQGTGREFIDDRIGFGKPMQGDALSADLAAILLHAQVRIHGYAIALQAGRLLSLRIRKRGARGASSNAVNIKAKRGDFIWYMGFPLL